MKHSCPLCGNSGKAFFKDEFFECINCKGIFRNSDSFPDYNSEKSRYEEHNNDVCDPGYQKFVSPATSFVMNNFKAQDSGLDYGCGPGPVVAKVLMDNNYNIEQFDPFFKNDEKLLKEKYDYIVCCEVIEHFHQPKEEFRKLKEMLKEDGKLVCMTHIYTPDIPFDNWYYKNDQTHVFIYQKETIEFIAEYFNFSSVAIDKKLVVFRKQLSCPKIISLKD